MTNREEARLSMYLTFRDFQQGNTTITNTLPNYQANLTTFLSLIPQIQAYSTQQGTSKKGITQNKQQLKGNLITLTADYSRKLKAYALFNNNTTLAEEINFAESRLKRISDTTVRDYGQLVYDRAQANIAALATYGITTATQTTLQNAITAYNASIGRPGLGRTEKGQSTRQLKALFKAAETALKNMDTAVEIVRLSQPIFYSGYQKARKVILTGIGTLSVKASVTDAKSGKPLTGVKVLFYTNGVAAGEKELTAGKPVVMKKTAAKGGFVIKSLPEGTYLVRLAKPGYAEKSVTLSVSDGEMATLNVSLEKA